ncbi:Uncharacterised protein [Segatella copri]|nr:Uncharacterised protein [Segatella copri]
MLGISLYNLSQLWHHISTTLILSLNISQLCGSQLLFLYQSVITTEHP